jgi:hypothetical protein
VISGEAEYGGQSCRTLRQFGVTTCRRPAGLGCVQPFDHLTGTQQDSTRHSLGHRYHVRAEVLAIDEVHVQVAGGPEHDGVAFGTTAVGVRSRVIEAAICLDLDQPGGDMSVADVGDHYATEQQSGRIERVDRQLTPGQLISDAVGRLPGGVRYRRAPGGTVAVYRSVHDE